MKNYNKTQKTINLNEITKSIGLFSHTEEFESNLHTSHNKTKFLIRLTKNPAEFLIKDDIRKNHFINHLCEITDKAMNKDSRGHSFTREKIEDFLPKEGWFAEIWDIGNIKLAGYSSVSEIICTMTYHDVENVIDINGSNEERDLFAKGKLIHKDDIDKIFEGYNFICYFIKSFMITPEYQSNYIGTSTLGIIFKNAIKHNSTNNKHHLNLKIDGSINKNRIVSTEKELFSAAIAANIRSCIAMSLFPKIYPNAIHPHEVDWLEKTKRYVVSGRKELYGGFIIKDRYLPGLAYPLDEDGKNIIPEKERMYGKGKCWYDFLRNYNYEPSKDAVLLSGWASLPKANKVTAHIDSVCYER